MITDQLMLLFPAHELLLHPVSNIKLIPTKLTTKILKGQDGKNDHQCHLLIST